MKVINIKLPYKFSLGSIPFYVLARFTAYIVGLFLHFFLAGVLIAQ